MDNVIILPRDGRLKIYDAPYFSSGRNFALVTYRHTRDAREITLQVVAMVDVYVCVCVFVFVRTYV